MTKIESGTLEKYSILRIRLAELQSEIRELEPQILEHLQSINKPAKTPFGTIAKVTRQKWVYSDSYKALETSYKEKLAKQRQGEKEAGTAELVETPVGLRFIVKKEEK